MRSRLLVLLTTAAIILCASLVQATDLRGRIDGVNPYTHTAGPLPGVSIALFVVYPNGQYGIVRQTVTGIDGMYYLPGVFPGQYILQVGGVNYPLQVAAVPLQDIPIIRR